MNVNSDYEVIIAGGGPSGCAAAAAAARKGAKTLLIEATYTLGGMGTSGLVTCFAPFGDGEKQIYCGIAKEVSRKSNRAAWRTEEDALGWVTSSPEDLKRIYDALVTESGADILFGSQICDATAADGRVTHITVANKSGLTQYTANLFVDCTGDGDLAAWAGASFALGAQDGTLQPATLCFVLTNINQQAYDKLTMNGGCPESPIHKILALGDKYPLITDEHLCVDELWPGTVSFNAGHLWESDGTDIMQVSRSVVRGRELARQFRDALAEVEPEAFADAYLLATAPVLGVRESRRIAGEYTLTLQDYLERKTFPDEIARNCYYIDVHSAVRRSENENAAQAAEHHYEKGESHGIPFRCLIPKGFDNLLVAGRAISCDRIVMGSTRVMPNCLTTGQAAGTAAVLALRSGGSVHGVDVAQLRQILREDGAYFL